MGWWTVEVRDEVPGMRINNLLLQGQQSSTAGAKDERVFALHMTSLVQSSASYMASKPAKNISECRVTTEYLWPKEKQTTNVTAGSSLLL